MIIGAFAATVYGITRVTCDVGIVVGLKERHIEALAIANRCIAAPTLLLYEVGNALYGYQRAGMMSGEAVRLALRAALSLPLRLRGEPELHTRALDLTERFSLPAAHDAHYLALADWLGAEFWTADRCLARVVQDTLPWVRAVGVTG